MTTLYFVYLHLCSFNNHFSTICYVTKGEIRLIGFVLLKLETVARKTRGVSLDFVFQIFTIIFPNHTVNIFHLQETCKQALTNGGDDKYLLDSPVKYFRWNSSRIFISAEFLAKQWGIFITVKILVRNIVTVDKCKIKRWSNCF